MAAYFNWTPEALSECPPSRDMFLGVKANSRQIGKVPFADSPVSAFGRSRPAADASREVEERWLLYGL
jgi:hypothetical protein